MDNFQLIAFTFEFHPQSALTMTTAAPCRPVPWCLTALLLPITLPRDTTIPNEDTKLTRDTHTHIGPKLSSIPC